MNIESAIYILAAFLGWLVAQSIKFALSLRKDGFAMKDLVTSGGMPSSHSSYMTSVTTVIGLVEGFDSAVFGLSFAVLGIVVYDSFGVRRAAGENIRVTLVILKQLKLNNKENAIHLALGHTPLQVAAGMVVGALTGTILYAIVV